MTRVYLWLIEWACQRLGLTTTTYLDARRKTPIAIIAVPPDWEEQIHIMPTTRPVIFH